MWEGVGHGEYHTFPHRGVRVYCCSSNVVRLHIGPHSLIFWGISCTPVSVTYSCEYCVLERGWATEESHTFTLRGVKVHCLDEHQVLRY